MPGPVFRSGERLSLRTVEPEDYDFVHRHWNEPAIRRATNQYDPRSREDVARVFDDDESSVFFLPSRDGDPTGFVWLFDLDPVAGRGEVGYWIADAERGNGYATEALRLTVAYAFEERRLHEVLARVFEWNEASMRVLENVGFEREGRLRENYYVDGEYVDAALFGLLEGAAPE